MSPYRRHRLRCVARGISLRLRQILPEIAIPPLSRLSGSTFMHSLARLLAAKPVFIPADDIFVAALGRHADALGGSYILRSASVVQPLMDAEIEQICDSFLRSVGYVGIC